MDLIINGSSYVLEDGDPQRPLLWVLRDELGLTAPSTAAARVTAAPAPSIWTDCPPGAASRR